MAPSGAEAAEVGSKKLSSSTADLEGHEHGWEDYTCATQWEDFVRSLEDVLRDWKACHTGLKHLRGFVRGEVCSHFSSMSVNQTVPDDCTVGQVGSSTTSISEQKKSQFCARCNVDVDCRDSVSTRAVLHPTLISTARSTIAREKHSILFYFKL